MMTTTLTPVQTITPDITILKNLTAVRLDVTIWTARKKLTPADFGASDLPPEKLASLGSKKVCNPDDLRIFATLKARAVALLERHGVRFLGGWAIPENNAAMIVQDLQVIASDFAKAKETFLASYDQAVRQWIVDNPGWEPLIAGSLVDVDTVRARLSFGWQVFKVAPTKGRSKDPGDSLASEVGTLSATLFDEIGKAAAETWKKSFAGKTEVTHKALSPLRAMMTKLSGLSFIEPRVAPIVSLVNMVLSIMPGRGGIDGRNMAMLQGLISLMSKPYALLQQGQRILDGTPCQAVMDELVHMPVPTANEEPNTRNPSPNPNHDTNDDEAAPGLDSLGLW